MVKRLISFNRSPTWVAPEFAGQFAAEGRDTKYTEAQKRKFRDDREHFTQYRRDIEHGMNSRFPSFYKHSAAQRVGRQMVADSMRKRLNDDPELVEKLVPKFELGCRR